MNAIRSWGADFARRLGIGGVIDFDRTTVGKTLHVPCAVGKHHVDVSVKPDMDPNGTVKHMLNQGWTVGRRRLVCPDCKRKTEQEKEDAKAERRREKETAPPKVTLTPEQRREKQSAAGKARQAQVTLEQRREWGRIGGFRKQENKLKREGRIPAAPAPTIREKEPKMPQQEPVTATDKARAAKRDAMDLLSLAFKLAPDSKSGVYSDGYSDARIAKEAGLAESVILALREEFFGPLGEPNELRAIRDDLAMAKLSLGATKSAGDAEIARIERKLNAVCSKNGWPVT